MTTSLLPADAVSWTPAAEASPPVAVEAGTLLATAPPGVLHPGDGVAGITRGGRVELRATRDGMPLRDGDDLQVSPLQVIEGTLDRSVGDRDVRGALRVEGSVSVGRRVGATAGIVVTGMVDRAAIHAGGELVVEGRAGASVMEAGDVSEMRRGLQTALEGAPAELDALATLAAQLVAAAGDRGAAVAPARVVETLLEHRFPGLVERLFRAEALIAGARRSRPGLAPALALELASARATLADPGRGPDPVSRLAGAAAFLTAALAARPPAVPAGIRVAVAHGTRIACPGTLRLTGAGATDCDIAVGGDLFAVAHGCALRGGHVSVGGRLRARELAGRESAPLRIVMRDARPGPDLLCADVAHPGVEILVGRELVRIDHRRQDLRIGIEAGRAVVASR